MWEYTLSLVLRRISVVGHGEDEPFLETVLVVVAQPVVAKHLLRLIENALLACLIRACAFVKVFVVTPLVVLKHVTHIVLLLQVVRFVLMLLIGAPHQAQHRPTLLVVHKKHVVAVGVTLGHVTG